MYPDNSLLPKEAIRLAALGALADGPQAYGELANEVRHFISRIAGPSLELMGTSIELLRFEELVEPSGNEDDAILNITDRGRDELLRLLTSAVRAPFNDVNKLVMALKMRFLHFLGASDRRSQMDMMIEACHGELTRLEDLRDHHGKFSEQFAEWLDHDIGLVRARLDWLTETRAAI